MSITRLPAFPLITSDPYFSIWSGSDNPTREDTRHWCGITKRLRGDVTVDGTAYRFLGNGEAEAMTLTDLQVTPTATEYKLTAGGVALTMRFTAPHLLHDLDVLSTPIHFVDFTTVSTDGKEHQAALRFAMYDDICTEHAEAPDMIGETYCTDGLQIAFMGQKRQEILCHSGDNISINWGYAYFGAEQGLSWEPMEDRTALVARAEGAVGTQPFVYHLLVGYDDVRSINYFGYMARAWYARNGKMFREVMVEFAHRRVELLAACAKVDAELLAEARKIGGDDYAFILSAAYRQSIAAHKLVADREGNAVFLSKECSSNGCIGTVDVSYPSIPLYLLYNPELVRAMCRPIFKFSALPCWDYDFAPHDVGRYPYATGQVYGVNGKYFPRNHEVVPPIYMFPAQPDLFRHESQMPVEECGNMLIMVAATIHADGDTTMAAENLPQLEQWVQYLLRYGEDPADQLCTDDFAGHSARNTNLAAKAICGVASFGLIHQALGNQAEADNYLARAREMAASWLERAKVDDHTALSFDGTGWSLKYNLVWDKLFHLNLLPDSFYEAEVASYIPRSNTYGCPLDCRKDYTKSDWILWCAAMTENRQVFDGLIAPMARYLRESASRQPFGDWYDTKTGEYIMFRNRTVQGGLFMPLLKEHWAE